MLGAKNYVMLIFLLILSSSCATTQRLPASTITGETEPGAAGAAAPASASAVTTTHTINGTASIPAGLFNQNQLPNVIALDQKFFITYYNKALRLPEFSEYTLTAENLKKSFVKRKDHFHVDAQLVAMGLDPVKPTDYRGSGYDRGHMAPSGDFTWSEEANEATFVMSNMAPQKPGLNRQAWEKLEMRVRRWACAEGKLRVITGPILEGNLTNLPTGVTVPEKFYKIIIDEAQPAKAIGFVMSQEDSDWGTLDKAHMPIKNIEAMTGINFVARLNEADRDRIENDDDLTEWKEADCGGGHAGGGGGHGNPGRKNGVNPATGGGASDVACSMGILKSATISGCCRGHHGVMGPKHLHACCNETNQVFCNDGQLDNSCKCDE